MDLAGEAPARRKVLRLSRTVEEGHVPRSSRGRVEESLVGQADALPNPEVTSAAANKLLAAVQAAAGELGEAPVAGNLSSAQVLQDESTRLSASRWRAGDPRRRFTAALAKVRLALQEWARGPASAAMRRQHGPVEPLPVRPPNGNARAPPTSSTTSWTTWLQRLPRPGFTWKWWVVAALVLLFPRLVALCAALAVRLVLRALVSLTTHLVKEVYNQALLITADMEEQAMSWLQLQLGFETAPPLQLPDQAAAAMAAPAQPGPPATTAPHPTRPMDWATLILLILNLRRAHGGGGEVQRHP